MQTYRLYHYEVWGNAEDGFDVNDVMRTSLTLELPEEWTNAGVAFALVAEGIADTGRVEVDPNIMHDGDTIYLVSTEHGNPVAELRMEEA